MFKNKIEDKNEKHALDLAIKFPKENDFMTYDLHRDHPQVWELRCNFTRSFWRTHDELGAF